MAATYNDTIDAGADYDLVLYDKQSNGQPTNLTGCTAEMQLRTSASAVDATLTLTSDPAAGITITAATGKIAINIPAADTATLTEDSYVYALELTWGSGAIDRILEGTFTMSAEVVRDPVP